MTGGELSDSVPLPVIDYTDKDFRSLREAMLRLARQRLPEWTDQSPADLGVLLVDLFAYVGDVVLYYQDRIANELFPGTATERESVVDLLRLIGYELSPASPAMADLTLTFSVPEKPTEPTTVTVPTGARFATRPTNGSPVEFTYLGPSLDIPLRSDVVRRDAPDDRVVHYDGLPVEQSSVVAPVVIGSSTAEPNQTFQLPDQSVVVGSVRVEVDEGAGWVGWERRDSLLFDIAPDGRVVFSHPAARHYQLMVEASGTPTVVFGAGRRPPAGVNNVRASYRRCEGARGNVATGTITAALTPIAGLRAVTNPVAAVGGSDAERSEHAARYAPFVFRSTNRAVTVSDYVALAHATGAVAKVRAVSRAWNQVDLYVAPTGDRLQPVPESLRHRLIGYFEDKRMAGTLTRVIDAGEAPVDIAVDLLSDDRFVPEAVVGAVEQAVRDLFAFAHVDFGQTVYQSDVYARVESVPGVVGARVTRFRRADRPLPDVEAELANHGLPPVAQLPPFLRDAIAVEASADGKVAAGEFEIPVLHHLDVRARTDLA